MKRTKKKEISVTERKRKKNFNEKEKSQVINYDRTENERKKEQKYI